MKRIGKFAVGSLVGAVLALGIGGVAVAAPVTTTGATTSSPATSTTGTSTPGTSTPGTSTPGTSTPGTSTPGTSTPATTPPPTSAKSKSTVLLGPAIWRVVEPHHKIDCARSAKEIARIQTAMASASQRQSRWQKRSGKAQTHNARNATKKTTRHVRHSSHKVSGYQKLQQEGAALIKRIDAKCGVSTPAH